MARLSTRGSRNGLGARNNSPDATRRDNEKGRQPTRLAAPTYRTELVVVRRPGWRRIPVIGAIALTFFALTALVAAGVLRGFDQLAIDHLMPGLEVKPQHAGLLEGVVPYFRGGPTDTTIQRIADWSVLPADPLPASLLLFLSCIVLWRRDRARDAVALATIALTGVTIEQLVKAAVTRPALHFHMRPETITKLESSYPSGHALFGILLAAAALLLFPRRARAFVLAWLTLALPMLVVGGFHTPTDVLGGALLGAVLVIALPRVSPHSVARQTPSLSPCAALLPAHVHLRFPPRSLNLRRGLRDVFRSLSARGTRRGVAD